MLVVIEIIHITCRHAKLKNLINWNCFSASKTTETVLANQTEEFCTAQWYVIAALTMMAILLIVYICLSNQRCTIFKRRHSNTVTIMLFFSDIKQYIPVKLCKSAGSIHLFQLYGQLHSDQIAIERNCLWDMIKIDWKEACVTLNGTIIKMPKSVKVPIRDKYGLRTLMTLPISYLNKLNSIFQSSQLKVSEIYFSSDF